MSVPYTAVQFRYGSIWR